MRDIKIELLRALLMLGICILHSFSHGAFPNKTIINLLSTCVCGFVFISGWFGVCFNVRKILLLYAIGFCSAIMCSFVSILMPGMFNVASLSHIAIRMWKHYWFLNAYVVMMCFAPIVNFAVDSIKGVKVVSVVGPILSFTYLWSWLTDIPYLNRVVPYTSGLGAYCGFTLLSIYTVARLCSQYLPKVSMRKVCIVLIASGLAVALFGGEYHSPFAVVYAASWFYMFKAFTWHIPKSLASIITAANPSLFAIYCLHSHWSDGFAIISSVEKVLSNRMPNIASCILVGILIFCICFIADIPRRMLFFAVNKSFTRVKGRA